MSRKSSIGTSASRLSSVTALTGYGLIIRADKDNTAAVFFDNDAAVTAGSADATSGIPLYPGDVVNLDSAFVGDAHDLYVVAPSGSQTIYWDTNVRSLEPAGSSGGSVDTTGLATEARQTTGNSLLTTLGSQIATLLLQTDQLESPIASLVTALGEVQTSPTVNTLLDRIKQLHTDLSTGPVPAKIDQTTPGTTNRTTAGGYKQSVAVEFTRPANTTAYAALDVLGVSLTVSGATNASPIVLTTGTHGLADGDPVTVTSVGGNTNANGDRFAKVTGYSSTTFGLYSDKALTTPVAGNSAYTSGGAVARLFRLPNAARAVALGGYVVKAQLMTDLKTCVARVRVHLFNAPVTAILDKSPYLKLYANRAARVGDFTFPALATEDPTNSTAAGAQLAAGDIGPLGFLAAAADADLYYMLEVLDAFTPASGQNVYLRLLFEDD